LIDLLRQIIAESRRPVQPPRESEEDRVARHIERATVHLYESVRPAGGLNFYDLTRDQRKAYRNLITTARDLTDLRPTVEESR